MPAELFEEEGLRKHIREYPWTEAGKSILRDIIGMDEVLTRGHLLPEPIGLVKDRFHLSRYIIFDGPLLFFMELIKEADRYFQWATMALLYQYSLLLKDPLCRKPSPLLFATLLYTMKDHFDMDKIFRMLHMLHMNGKT